MNATKRRAIFEALKAANPNPTTELEYTTPFELLVSVILSAQATDKSVNAVTRKLFPIARTPAAIRDLGVDGLSKYIRTIGLWRAKAKNVIATASAIADRYDGVVPNSREALEELPGVGRKTANVVLNTIFGEPTIAVDTHIFRVANRTRLAPGKTPRAVEDALIRVTPGEFAHDAHHWLILHGRYTCKALKPECARCPINAQCEWTGRRRILLAAVRAS